MDLGTALASAPVEAPIDVLLARCASMPKEDVIQQMQRASRELLVLQYRLREHALVEWFQSMDEDRKRLHRMFEDVRPELKRESNGRNWVILSLEQALPEQENLNDLWYAFDGDTDSMLARIDAVQDKVLCEPLFADI